MVAPLNCTPSPYPQPFSKRRADLPGLPLAAGLFTIAAVAALLAGWVPIVFSIATVFLFAGPHNWLEARYILGRLPARAGKLWGFFAVSFAGIIGLTIAFAAHPVVPGQCARSPCESDTLYAGWNTAFLLWVAALVWMRSRTRTRGSTAGGCGRRPCCSWPACGSSRSR